MGKTRLLVVGAGVHGRSVAEAAKLSGLITVVGFFYNALPASERALGLSVLGPVASIAQHLSEADLAIVAIGNNAMREKLMHQLSEAGFALAKVVHPRACVSPSAVVCEGSAIMAAVIVGTEARLGIGSIVNCGAVVDHHVTVQNFDHLGVNACTAAGTVMGRSAWMQAGAALGYGVKIPSRVTLDPGEAVDAKTNQYKND